MVDWIQEARDKKASGVIINAGAYTHTSVAILDALVTLTAPIIEVHITNIHARERFRQRSYVSRRRARWSAASASTAMRSPLTGLPK